MNPDDQPLTVKITAEVLPGKEDYAATAWFTNGQRAAQYATEVLIPTGDYRSGGVWLTDTRGARWRIDTPDIDPAAAVEDNERQYRDQANAIAQQAEALASGAIPNGQRYAQVRRLANNIDTLMAWTEDDRRA